MFGLKGTFHTGSSCGRQYPGSSVVSMAVGSNDTCCPHLLPQSRLWAGLTDWVLSIILYHWKCTMFNIWPFLMLFKYPLRAIQLDPFIYLTSNNKCFRCRHILPPNTNLSTTTHLHHKICFVGTIISFPSFLLIATEFSLLHFSSLKLYSSQ